MIEFNENQAKNVGTIDLKISTGVAPVVGDVCTIYHIDKLLSVLKKLRIQK